MNWGEFKAKLEADGVTDALEIIYMDFEHCHQPDAIKIILIKDSFYIKNKHDLNDDVDANSDTDRFDGVWND